MRATNLRNHVSSSTTTAACTEEQDSRFAGCVHHPDESKGGELPLVSDSNSLRSCRGEYHRQPAGALRWPRSCPILSCGWFLKRSARPESAQVELDELLGLELASPGTMQGFLKHLKRHRRAMETPTRLDDESAVEAGVLVLNLGGLLLMPVEQEEGGRHVLISGSPTRTTIPTIGKPSLSI